MDMFLAIAIYFKADGNVIDVPAVLEGVTYQQCMSVIINVAENVLNNPEMNVISYAVNCHAMSSLSIF